MANKKSTKLGSSNKRRPPSHPSEWIAGIFPLAGYVADGPVPEKPWALIWMSALGFVVGTHIARQDEILDSALASFEQAIQSPILGRPGIPPRLRVSSKELATVISAAYPEIKIRVAATPEIDTLRESLNAHLTENAPLMDDTYLASGASEAAVADFFAASAELFKLKPWDLVPGDQCVIRVTIPSLSVKDAVISVIGQAGESLGFILFFSIDDFFDFLDASEAIRMGVIDVTIPCHLSLNFERGADLSSKRRKEVSKHQWPIVTAKAYPVPLRIDEEQCEVPLADEDYLRLEVIARALCVILKENIEDMGAAWNGGLWARELEVPTRHGPVNLILGAEGYTDMTEMLGLNK